MAVKTVTKLTIEDLGDDVELEVNPFDGKVVFRDADEDVVNLTMTCKEAIELSDALIAAVKLIEKT